MSLQGGSDSSNRSSITLELVPEDPRDADPALIDAVGRDTADALRTEGYAVEPLYTTHRGGFFVDVIIPFLNVIWTNKDVILADGSALVTILTPIVLIARSLYKAHEKRVGKEASQQSSIKITAEIDGVPISIEATDLGTADAALKLAQRFQTQHPAAAAKVTPRSNIKVKGTVPKRQQRKRR